MDIAKEKLRRQKYWLKHKKRINERQKLKRKTDLVWAEKVRRYSNEYKKTNPRGIFDVVKRSAKIRNLELNITRDEFANWYTAQERVCIYCGRTEADVIADTDIIQTWAKRLSIDRLDNAKGYSLDNIGLCCRRCNIIKGNFFTTEEMKEVGQIIKRRYAQ